MALARLRWHPRRGAADNQWRRAANTGPVVGSADARGCRLGQVRLSLRQLDSGGQHHERGAWCSTRRRTAAQRQPKRPASPRRQTAREPTPAPPPRAATAGSAPSPAGAAATTADSAASPATSGAGCARACCAARAGRARPALHPLNSARTGIRKDNRPQAVLIRQAMFASVLIANRGEIACRIARTAERLGLAHHRGLFAGRCQCAPCAAMRRGAIRSVPRLPPRVISSSTG